MTPEVQVEGSTTDSNRTLRFWSTSAFSAQRRRSPGTRVLASLDSNEVSSVRPGPFDLLVSGRGATGPPRRTPSTEDESLTPTPLSPVGYPCPLLGEGQGPQ